MTAAEAALLVRCCRKPHPDCGRTAILSGARAARDKVLARMGQPLAC
ncbi:MAG: hypothetical protein R3F44_14670 [Candidatus Competibacteraceae bacterium]